MKKRLILFISLFLVCIVNGQSELIKQVFRLLPASKVYDLSLATRDSMLAGKAYYPSSNDSDEIAVYNYGLSPEVNDYLYISLSFETAQRGTGMIEIRGFKMNNEEHLILVSQTGGVWQVTYAQHELSAFVYNKHQHLIPCKNKFLPKANDTLFIKKDTPATLKKEIQSYSNTIYDLSKDKVILALNSSTLSNDKKLNRWLKADEIHFVWINNHFVSSNP